MVGRQISKIAGGQFRVRRQKYIRMTRFASSFVVKALLSFKKLKMSASWLSAPVLCRKSMMQTIFARPTPRPRANGAMLRGCSASVWKDSGTGLLLPYVDPRLGSLNIAVGDLAFSELGFAPTPKSFWELKAWTSDILLLCNDIEESRMSIPLVGFSSCNLLRRTQICWYCIINPSLRLRKSSVDQMPPLERYDEPHTGL